MHAQAAPLDRRGLGEAPQTGGPQREFVSLRGGRRAMPKLALTADLLATLVERRLRWLPAVLEALARDPLCTPRLPRPRRHERDPAGRNWDLPGFAFGPIDETACPERFRTVVDRLRDEFDIT